MSHRGQVDNCKATLPEGNTGLPARPHPTIIWAAVTNTFRHSRNERFQFSRVATVTVPNTGNSAHN